MAALLVMPLVCGILVTASAAAFAAATPAPQPAAPATRAHHHHHRSRMLAALERLDLSGDQKAKIEEYLTAYRDARSTAAPQTRKELRARIERVLTSVQRANFEAQMKRSAARASG